MYTTGQAVTIFAFSLNRRLETQVSGQKKGNLCTALTCVTHILVDYFYIDKSRIVATIEAITTVHDNSIQIENMLCCQIRSSFTLIANTVECGDQTRTTIQFLCVHIAIKT